MEDAAESISPAYVQVGDRITTLMTDKLYPMTTAGGDSHAVPDISKLSASVVRGRWATPRTLRSAPAAALAHVPSGGLTADGDGQGTPCLGLSVNKAVSTRS